MIQMNNFLYGDIHFKELYNFISCFPLLSLILASLEAFCMQTLCKITKLTMRFRSNCEKSFSYTRQISMNVKMESMIALLVWLPV